MSAPSESGSLLKQAFAGPDGSPDAAIVKEVSGWFQHFVGDKEILNATNIDINVLGTIVAQSGATARDLRTIFQAKEHADKSLDVAGIRYPEPNRPNFSIFRIHLTAWSDCTRTLMTQTDSNGITGELYETAYVPRAETMSSLKDETRLKAVETARAMFDE